MDATGIADRPRIVMAEKVSREPSGTQRAV
jgi:hypothetical protein